MEVDAERNVDNLAMMYGFLWALFCFCLFLECSAEDAPPLRPQLAVISDPGWTLGGPWLNFSKVH